MKVLGFTRRVVIDTNVLVSALLTPNGPSIQGKKCPIPKMRRSMWLQDALVRC